MNADVTRAPLTGPDQHTRPTQDGASASPTAERFLTLALDVIHRAVDTQREAIDRAAELIATRLADGGHWWAFGTGHSHMLVEELWGRAGGLVECRPILEPSLMLHEGLDKSSLLERQAGLAETLLEIHPVGSGDCLLVVSNSGRNAVPVEFAAGARRRGAAVIALTSLAHSAAVASRAPSGRRLFELADVVIDNCGVPGDAVVPHEPHPVGPTSTIVGALLAQALSVEVIGRMERRGRPLATLLSINA